MALWVMMMRKMVKNKWLELSLLLGLVISVGLAASMPIYTGAILQRSLIKDLESASIGYPAVSRRFLGVRLCLRPGSC
ncbi:hypothetical protein LJK88_28890 [Paenibacillus sp. P26]|nr:hypothetical protein LJK88_28890 [Paenibacillus sp. P26]